MSRIELIPRFITLLLSLLFSAAAPAVDLNTATRAELEQLNGLGVSTAARVLEERNKAPFADWADLSRRVKGIKAQRVEQLRQQGVSINGKPAPVGEK
jgi:competence protein ComEA